MKNEVWFFIGLFVFIFVVWIAIGGAGRTPSLALPSLPSGSSTTTPLGESIFLSLPRAPFVIGTSHVELAGSSGSNDTSSLEPSVAPLITVPGVIFAPQSSYRGIVSMDSFVSNASSTDAREEYVELSVADNASAPVDITGWILGSGATGNEAVIPRGTAVPTSGVVNATSDIVLNPGDSAIVVSGISPVGASFRENKCIGYFGSAQTFTPPLPTDCPSAADELTMFYGKPYIHDPTCIDYADSLAPCQIPTPAGSAPLSLACQDFLETHLNYNDCVITHGNDSDFAGTIWHIYLGRANDQPLWRENHEVVELLDRNDYTVDAFTY